MEQSLLFQRLKRKISKKIRVSKSRIFGHQVEANQHATSFLGNVYGINHSRASKYILQFGYRPHVKCRRLKARQWLKIKRQVERRADLEKALRKFSLLSLRNRVNQGNFYASRFWRGLPVHGQNSRTNGRTAKKINLSRIPANMRVKVAAPTSVSTRGKGKGKKDKK